MDNKKICGKCNTENDINSKFCIKCGNNLTTTVTPPPEKKNNSLSIAGFICSIVGVATCGITSLIGLILSIVGLSSSKKKGQKDPFALAGIIISVIYIAILILIIVFVIFTSKDIKVADFSTMTKSEASEWCDNNDANCYFYEEYSDTIKEGNFIRQSRSAGSEMSSYESINIYYSKGKEEQSSTPAPTTSSETTPKTQNVNEKFSLVEDYISPESNDFSTYIEGKIINNSNKELSYIQVTYSIYDEEGNTIGTCLDNENNLDAHGTWKFKALCVEGVSNVSKYELKEITGW